MCPRKSLVLVLVVALPFPTHGQDIPEPEKVALPRPEPGFTVVIDDVGKYLKQADVPRCKGPITFSFNGKVSEKGKKVIEATYGYGYGYNGFEQGYQLTGLLRADKLEKKQLTAEDFASIRITYTDDLLEAKDLTEKDIPALIEQLTKPGNNVEWIGTFTPGGEILKFSPPMKKLIILGQKARVPLQERLGDQRIQNEVVLILGAIGDESTVPALIKLYPEADPQKANREESDRRMCLTFALAYLTGRPIGWSRSGIDLEPGNGKRWRDWWANEGKTFKVPVTKPTEIYLPCYPILTKEWAIKCREKFARGE